MKVIDKSKIAAINIGQQISLKDYTYIKDCNIDMELNVETTSESEKRLWAIISEIQSLKNKLDRLDSSDSHFRERIRRLEESKDSSKVKNSEFNLSLNLTIFALIISVTTIIVVVANA